MKISFDNLCIFNLRDPSTKSERERERESEREREREREGAC